MTRLKLRVSILAALAFLLVLSSCGYVMVETPAPAPAEPPSARDVTLAYVQKAIERYEQDGLDAVIEFYGSRESIEDDRSLMLLRAGEQTVLTTSIYRAMIGTSAFSGPNTPLGRGFAQATAEGYWFQGFTLNPQTGEQEPGEFVAILHEGLIFVSTHAVLRKNLAEATKDYVERAISFFDREGLDATIARYNSRESLEGQFYLFLIGADDNYLVHPIFPHLKDTDIKNVVGSDGYELGKEIARATAEGHWVDYLWPHPISGLEEPKSSWAIRHAGLIFASGYYTPDEDAEAPVWQNADPHEYTVTYVQNAIERYERVGLQAFKHYYQSVASFEGQWYLFVTNADDIYIVHSLLPHLLGTDIKQVVDSTGYELGKEIANATAEGHWIEYLWPHPFTLQDAPKIAYAVRHDNLIFASGYYPLSDPEAATRAYIEKAIAYYDEHGLEATVEYYNSVESIEQQWFLELRNSDGIILTYAIAPKVVGSHSSKTGTPEGTWYVLDADNPQTPEKDKQRLLLILHDGLHFGAGYFFSE